MDASDILLADILAAPEDDFPRRVYADWCEDRGDSRRAEFIRRQLAGETVPAEAEWLGELRPHARSWEFSRGFVHHLEMRAADLLRHHALVARSVPLSSLRLVECGERGVLDRVAALPILKRLRTLDLSGNDLDELDLERLLDTESLEELRTLRMNENSYGYDAVGAVASSRALWKLEVLEMRRNNLRDESAVLLGDARSLTGLKVLDLRGNAISGGGQTELRRFFPGAPIF